MTCSGHAEGRWREEVEEAEEKRTEGRLRKLGISRGVNRLQHKETNKQRLGRWRQENGQTGNLLLKYHSQSHPFFTELYLA